MTKGVVLGTLRQAGARCWTDTFIMGCATPERQTLMLPEFCRDALFRNKESATATPLLVKRQLDRVRVSDLGLD